LARHWRRFSGFVVQVASTPTGNVDQLRAFREIEVRLMDVAARTQSSVQEHRCGCGLRLETHARDWSVHFGLTARVKGTWDSLRIEDSSILNEGVAA